MPIVLLQMIDSDMDVGDRPPQCPHCSSPVLQSWGSVSRNLEDSQAVQASLRRYHCKACNRTFRVYPEGVGRSSYTERLRMMVALACLMGLSCREVVEIFTEMGVALSRMAVWRFAQELIQFQKASSEVKTLRKYAIDTYFIPSVSNKLGVVVAMRVRDGRPVILGTLDECNPRNVKSWLESLVGDVGIMVRILGTETLYTLPVDIA